MSPELTTDQNGAIAEAAIVLASMRSGFAVYRPVGEGGRSDLILDVGGRLLRVQCKSAMKSGDVVHIHCYSTRRTIRGMVNRPYTAAEVDAIVGYCAELDRCYFIPIELVDGRRLIQLRLAATRNNQKLRIRWAREYEFERLHFPSPGAVAQLGERCDGIAEAAGSSPAGSTLF